MFNFAAAVSERFRIFRSTKVHPFVSEAEDGFPAKEGGDKTQGYQRGTQLSISGKYRCISVDSPSGRGVHQLMRGGGTTGPGARSTGQTSGSETSSRGDEGYTAGDERHLKTPIKKLQRRSLFALRRTPRRPRQTKVQPLNIKASLSTRHQSSSCAHGSAYGTSFAPSSSSFSLKKSKQAEEQTSTAGGEASSSSVNHQVQSGLQSDLRLLRPWTARLRDFLLPRRGRKATAVLPMDKPRGSLVDRQSDGPLGDLCSRGYQSHGRGGLKARSGAKGVKGKKSHRLGSDDMVTSSKVTPHIDHYQLPGVPQLNLDSKSASSQDESDDGRSGSTLGQESDRDLTGCGGRPYADLGKNASSLKTINTTTGSSARDDGPLDAPRKDAACSSSPKKRGTVSDIASKGDAPISSVHPMKSIRQGVMTQEKQLPKYPKLPNREKEEAIFREHKFALGLNVGFIFESLVGCQGYPDCRWLDVMRSCILRKEKLRSLVADGNQFMPYTRYEIETINMNATLAIDRIYQLNKLVYEHVKQKKHGVKNLRLFEPVEKLLSNEPLVSALNENQARQEGVRTQSASPQPQPESKTATGTRQAALPKTAVTVTRGKLKKGVVGTVSRSEDNFLIPRKATVVKRQKRMLIPSMKVATRKLPSSKQGTQGGNGHVSPAKPSQEMNAQKLIKARTQCQNNTAASKQVKVATADNKQDALSKVKVNLPGLEKKSEPKNKRSTGIMKLRQATLFEMVKPDQAQKNTSNLAPAGKQQCSNTTSPRLVPKVGAAPAVQSSSSKPSVGATIPKIAPSCLKKLMPNIPTYPKIDPADLEHVIDTDGNKTILGRGNFAEVFLMRRLSDNTFVALKRLKKDHFRMTADFDMLQEVTALQAVRHSSYFPKLYGVVDFRSYAQELLGDGSVDSARNFTKARFQLSLLCRGEWFHVCRDITKAMMDLHRVGWLHNDLHTGNAMVCRNPPGSKFKWMGKMIDLGCAQSIYSLVPPWTLTKEQKQSFYQHAIQVAPEIVEGMTSHTVESDIYSLGRLFLTVAHEASCLSSLRLLGLSCMKRDPKLRPELKTVYKKINAICAKTKTASNEQPLSYVSPN